MNREFAKAVAHKRFEPTQYRSGIGFQFVAFRQSLPYITFHISKTRTNYVFLYDVSSAKNSITPFAHVTKTGDTYTLYSEDTGKELCKSEKLAKVMAVAELLRKKRTK